MELKFKMMCKAKFIEDYKYVNILLCKLTSYILKILNIFIIKCFISTIAIQDLRKLECENIPRLLFYLYSCF